MKKNLTLLAIVICCSYYSCKSKEQKLAELKEKLIPVLTENILSTYKIKIDSILISKIDTLSDSLYYAIREDKLTDSYNSYVKIINDNLKIDKDKKYEAREAYNAAHMELYTPDEETFRQEQMNVYQRKLDEAKGYEDNINSYLDTLKMINKETNLIDTILKTNKMNRHSFRGYYVHFRLVGANSDNTELNIDSLGMAISPTFRIMELGKL